MDIFREKSTFTQQANKRLDSSARAVFDDLVKEWSLFEWEDALVFQLYPLFEDDVVAEGDLLEVDVLIQNLRGADGTEPFGVDELDAINWQGGVEDGSDLQKRLFRTLYFCINKDDRILAMALRSTLDPVFIDQKQTFIETREVLIRPYNVLCAYFFFLLPDKLAYFLFESGFVLIGFKTGFDWEAIVRDATERMVSFNHRQNLCIELSASLSENRTPLGQDEKGVSKDIKYWIDNFRIFSKGEFGGQELFTFLDDDNYFGGCSGEDKDLISLIIQLYTHLINGFLAVPGGDLSAVEERVNALEKSGRAEDLFAYFDDKPQADISLSAKEIGVETQEDNTGDNNTFTVTNDDIRKIIISEFGYMPDGQYKNLEEIFTRLQELAVDFNRPEIADLYYFDEQKNKFVWKE